MRGYATFPGTAAHAAYLTSRQHCFDTVCLEESNAFSPLSHITSSPESPLSEIGSPTAASSPKCTSKMTPSRSGRKDTPLKVGVINCRSIVNKKAEMLNFVKATQADVIIGTESWLSKDIKDSEICPPGYNIFRKDRDGRGGGVFIMVCDKYISSDPGIPVPAEVEMVWCQVQIVGSKHLSICAFYRPPNNNDNKYLETLHETLSLIPNTNHLWVAGDFNLADIDWVTSSPYSQLSPSKYCKPAH